MTAQSSPQDGGEIESRKYPRRNIALDVSFGPASTAERPSDLQLEHTVTIDISIGGIGLYTDVLYPVGTKLYCALSLPDRALPMEALGAVAWFQNVSHEEHGYKLGLEFAEIAPEDRLMLERLVHEPPTSHLSRSRKLLLADDDRDFTQALKVRFESVGFEVLTAGEGLEALQKSRQEHPHLIILDLTLPKLNGYEICRLLKFDQKFHHIPIILCTARSRKDDIALGQSVGADAYVTKPFDGKVLLAKVDELLAKARH